MTYDVWPLPSVSTANCVPTVTVSANGFPALSPRIMLSEPPAWAAYAPVPNQKFQSSNLPPTENWSVQLSLSTWLKSCTHSVCAWMHDLTSATSALLMTTSAVPLSSAKVTADVSLTFRSAQTLPQLSELSLLGDRWATQERMFYGFCMFLRQNRTKSAKGKRKEQGKKMRGNFHGQCHCNASGRHFWIFCGA